MSVSDLDEQPPDTTTTDAVGRFVLVLHPYLTGRCLYEHTPIGGHSWRWLTPAGLWSLQAGGALEPGPLVLGPGGNRWRLDVSALHVPELVLRMLQLANAFGPDTSSRLVEDAIGEVPA